MKVDNVISIRSQRPLVAIVAPDETAHAPGAGLPLSTELSGRSAMFQALLLYKAFAGAAHTSNVATMRHEDLFEHLDDRARVIDIYAPLLDSRRVSENDDISRGRDVTGSLFEYG